MKDSHDLFLQCGFQINQHVTAANEIEFRKWRVFKNILLGENAQVADGFVNLVETVCLAEKSPQAFRRNVDFDILEVNARARSLQGRVADVRPKHLDGNVVGFVSEKLQQAHGQGVHFLSAGASGD